jgi:acyl-CoA synthetase (AMP-forming)/AMP-acid ligase II
MAAGVVAHARTQPDVPALIHGDRTVTYAQLDDRARRGAHALHGLGVRRGDRIAVMAKNSIEWFEAFHAAGRLGAKVVPINWHFKAGETGWIVSDSQAKVVVVDADLLPALADVAAVPRLVIGDAPGEAGWTAALDAVTADGEVDPPDVMGDAWPAYMAYTSGTTGRPKGVAIDLGDFRINAEGVGASGARWGLGHGDVHLLVGPAYHAGPGFWAQMHLAFGGTIVITDKWDARRCLSLIEQHRVTNSHMVPANFIRLLEVPSEERDRHDLSSLKMLVHAAAPCPIPVKRRMMDWLGAERIWEYYGSSEGGGTTISPEEWLAHPGSVGRPLAGTTFVAVDEDGHVQPPDVEGQIYVRLDAGGFVYHGDPEKTASVRRTIDGLDGWFTVGDIGRIDADGYLYITDRKSDMVISGGVNIYPREIEDCLYRHPGVADCVVFGVPDEQWGEQLVAVVQPRDSEAGRALAGDADAVVAWCREQLADYKRPRIVEFVDELVRDDNGKIRKPRLREEFMERRGLTTG